MKLTIIAVGGKHDSIFRNAIDEYTERLSRQYRVEWKLLPRNILGQERTCKKESEAIQKRIPKGSKIWVLDERGIELTSKQLAKALEHQLSTSKDLAIVIGGAYGVDEQLRSQSDLLWSLGKLIFPHQLVRVILTEQLYRAMSINQGSNYHHD
jgi:23S rRNA (pseudouridine1915-N3)-methyltransferase